MNVKIVITVLLNQNEQKQKEIDEQINKIKKLTDSLSEFKEELNIKEQEIISYKAEIKKSTNDLNAVHIEIEKIIKEKEEIASQCTLLTSEKEGLENQIKEKDKEAEQLSKLENEKKSEYCDNERRI